MQVSPAESVVKWRSLAKPIRDFNVSEASQVEILLHVIEYKPIGY